MNIIRSLYTNIFDEYEPTISTIKENYHLLNTYLIDTFSPLELILLTIFSTVFISIIYETLFGTDEDLMTRLYALIVRLIFRLPMVQRKINEARDSTLKSVRDDLARSIAGHEFITSLPEKGLACQNLVVKLEQYRKLQASNVQTGQVSGCLYKLPKADLTEIYHKALDLFGETNPLHVDVFPDIRTMEAEIVRCTVTMFHGDSNACGTMTSGGTESILMACKTYRDLAISKGIDKPEIVMPITAHPAFRKASYYFKMKLKRIPLNPKTCEVDLKKLRRAITKNTCMLVASAPNFPHGVIDPIEDISKIAMEYGIPLHVDACLGGFIIAFMDQAGFPLKPFDFRVPGVTSISCDTHKYGFAPKGTSIVLYRNEEIRRHQFFASADWPGGIYGSPTIAGSRSGYLIACCWATLMYYGVEGYVKETRRIIETTRAIADGLSRIDGIYLLHQPDASVVAIGSNKFNIYYLFDGLHAKGWHLIGLQDPPGMHIAVTQVHTQPGVTEKLLEDTKQCVNEILKADLKKDTRTAVIYGTNQKLLDKSLTCDMTKIYIRSWYDTTLNTAIGT